MKYMNYNMVMITVTIHSHVEVQIDYMGLSDISFQIHNSRPATISVYVPTKPMTVDCIFFELSISMNNYRV